MDTLDIVLINIISYMGGLITGLGFCFKYKKHFLLRTSSHDQLSDIINSIHSEIGGSTTIGPPIVASTPAINALEAPHETLKEIVIRTA